MTNSHQSTAHIVSIFLITACAVLAASTVSCAGKAADLPVEPRSIQTNQDTGFYIPETGNLVLVLGSDGQLEALSGPVGYQTADMTPGSNQRPEPAPFAIQTAIAAMQAPIDGGAVVAVNRIGLVFLEIQNRRVQVRRIPGADAEFAGRSVAQAWTWDGKAMVLLHRNEIFETGAARNPVARIISVTATEALALPAFGAEAGAFTQEDAALYGAPYAVFPRAANRWLVQFRLVDTEKTRTAFAAWNPGLIKTEQQKPLEPLDRSVYEAEARPVSLNEAPRALRLAADVLGGSLILDAVMPDGSHQSWLFGNIETALTARAWISETASAALASDGRIILMDADGIHPGTIPPPVSRAYFRDIALLGGFILAVWEEDLFPDLGRSGLVIMDAALLRK